MTAFTSPYLLAGRQEGPAVLAGPPSPPPSCRAPAKGGGHGRGVSSIGFCTEPPKTDAPQPPADPDSCR
eukprot:8186000-Pyramimonas_sp.AAC.1